MIKYCLCKLNLFIKLLVQVVEALFELEVVIDSDLEVVFDCDLEIV
jgi:hypothetical protein